VLLTSNVPLQIGKCTPRGTCTPGWESLTKQTQTLADLKDNIQREIRGIPANMIGRVIDNFNVRAGAAIHQKDAWIEHIINY